jgi:tetratricopeptide (TPR) repeat protein
MRLGKKVRVALVLLFAAAAFPAYRLSLYLYRNYHYHAAEEAMGRRDFREAGARLDRCLSAAPDDLPAQLLAAQAARRRGDLDEARRHLDAYQQGHGPEDALKRERRLVLVQQGDLTEAGRLLSSCLERPDDPETPLALEAGIEGSLKALVPAYTALKTFPGGSAAPQVKKVRQAVDLWLRLRPGRADQVEGLVWRARASAYANEPLAAREDARKALDLDPDHFQARLNLAIFLAPDAPAEAAGHLERLRRSHPDDRRVLFGLASVRRDLGQLDEAQEILDELLALDPDDVTTLLERGLVALDARPDRPEEAERWLRRAYDLDPNSAEVNLALSTCLTRAGRAAEARPYQERFQQLDAGRPRKTSQSRSDK